MTCIVETVPVRRERNRLAGLWHKLSLAFSFRRRSRRLPWLAADELSDHLKRDLGFLDGRG
ncbi:hypothetical protein MUO32_14890 [Shinella sp. CPCC 101442]|uniref:hypothetical protein n=1 Tax=Shinella sp. CPCC 101442 TaxID=2932265 RepID=UPI00215398AD|nr:hypothetical protein [Shinella sp. CPCC 101442]MCR6500335.1 hypothetical protein [Shinella sp. CPCC 101442]